MKRIVTSKGRAVIALALALGLSGCAGWCGDTIMCDPKPKWTGYALESK
ncbi:hypothetical protein [Rhizobium phage RHph_X2_26]|nr:hypothetical protein [Rhizobium phage RHph_X2_26]